MGYLYSFLRNYFLKVMAAFVLIFLITFIVILVTNTDVWAQYGTAESTLMVIRGDLLSEFQLLKEVPGFGNIFDFAEAYQWNVLDFERELYMAIISTVVGVVTLKPLKNGYMMLSNIIDRHFPSALFFVGDFLFYPIILVFAVIGKHMMKMYFIRNWVDRVGPELTLVLLILLILVGSYAVAFLLCPNRETRSRMTLQFAGKLLIDVLSVIVASFLALCFSEMLMSSRSSINEGLYKFYATISFMIVIVLYFVDKLKILDRKPIFK